MKSRAIRGIASLALCVLVCVCANILAFTIDTEDMREHVWQGCLMLGEQQSQPQTVGGFLSSQLDNFTGVLILKTAGYVGEENLLEKAMGGYRIDMPTQSGQSDWEAYCNYEFGELAPEGSRMFYARYWHGYTLPLRLMLCMLDMANIQMLLYFAQMVLLLAVLCMMVRRGLSMLIPAFFLAYFLLMPYSASICLQYVPVTMLMLSACLCILAADERIARFMPMPVFFALVGILTNYFDLLTFPFVSLCFPLVMLLALRMRCGESGAQLFVLTALCGISWALGYSLMWALKWLLTACVFGPGMLQNVFAQIGLRTSDNAGDISRFAVLMKNIDVMLAKKSYLLIIGVCGLAALVPAAKAIKKGVRIDLRALNLLLPALAVCLWILVMANHANDHTYFTYRNLTVCAFAGLSFISCLLAPKEE